MYIYLFLQLLILCPFLSIVISLAFNFTFFFVMNVSLLKLALSSSLSSPLLIATSTTLKNNFLLSELRAFRHFNAYFYSNVIFGRLDIVKSSFTQFIETPIKINNGGVLERKYMNFYHQSERYYDYSYVAILWCQFRDCYTNENGGALSIVGNQEIKISRNFFYNCKAEKYFAIIDLYNSKPLEISYCCFSKGDLPESFESQGIFHNGAIGNAHASSKFTFIYCTSRECPKSYRSQNDQLTMNINGPLYHNNCNISDGYGEWTVIYSISYFYGGNFNFNTYFNIKGGTIGIDFKNNPLKDTNYVDTCNFVKFKLWRSISIIILGYARFRNCVFIDISSDSNFHLFGRGVDWVENIYTDVSRDNIQIDGGCNAVSYCDSQIHYNQHWSHRIDFIRTGECFGNFLPPSLEFTPSSKFSPSNKFTASKQFTGTNIFTETNNFTETSNFQSSENFTLTNEFNESGFFSFSGDFTASQAFASDNLNAKELVLVVSVVGGVVIFLLVILIIVIIILIIIYKASKHAIESDSEVSFKSIHSSEMSYKSDVVGLSVSPLDISDEECDLVNPNEIDEDVGNNDKSGVFIPIIPIICTTEDNDIIHHEESDLYEEFEEIVFDKLEATHPICFYEPNETEKPMNKRKKVVRRRKKVIKTELLDTDEEIDFSAPRPDTPRKQEEKNQQELLSSFISHDDLSQKRKKKKIVRRRKKLEPSDVNILTDMNELSEEGID